MLRWLATQKGIYIGNAASVKDYRIQFRKKHASAPWIAYLVMLLLLATLVYAAAVGETAQSPAQIQSSLLEFFRTVTTILQLAVFFVAPIIAGGSIIAEYNRQSMDLIMVGPVTPKYFLIGKLISGFRQIALALILSLPMTSLSVIFGGATWSEVAWIYFSLLLQGLLFMAVSMPIAISSKNMSVTILLSYIISAFVSGFLWSVLGAGMAMGGANPWTQIIFTFLPFGYSLLATSTPIELWGMSIPYTIPGAILAFYLVRVLILGAGSAMMRYPAKETIHLRVHLLALFALLGLLVAIIAVGMSGAAGGLGAPSSSPLVSGITISTMCSLPFIVGLFLSGYVACFSFLETKGGVAPSFWQFKEIFRGRPSGGLGFMVLATTAILVPASILLYQSGITDITVYLAIYDYSYSFTFFSWSLAWFFSSKVKTLANGRRLTIGLLIAGSFLTSTLLGIIDSVWSISHSGLELWAYNPLFFVANDAVPFLIKSGILVFFALFLAAFGEKSRMQMAKQAGVTV